MFMSEPPTHISYALLRVISISSIFHKIPSINANQKKSIITDQVDGSILSKTNYNFLLSKFFIAIVIYLTLTQKFTTFIAFAFAAIQWRFHFLSFLFQTAFFFATYTEHIVYFYNFQKKHFQMIN